MRSSEFELDEVLNAIDENGQILINNGTHFEKLNSERVNNAKKMNLILIYVWGDINE